MTPKKVLVLGGTGHFGRLLIGDLHRYSDCDIIAPDRRLADLHDPVSLNRVLRDVSVAICAAGPFQTLPTTLARLCLRLGIHYIDLADDRAFVRKIRALVPDDAVNRPAICTSWSTVSALSGLLAQIAVSGLGPIDSLYIHMAPGNRGARSKGTIDSLIHSVGLPFKVFRNGAWCIVHGWSGKRVFKFPPPIGPRYGYLVDVPDHEFFPDLFKAGTVEFRTASELRVLNAAVSTLAWLMNRGVVHSWLPWSNLFTQMAALPSTLGHDWGGLGLEVRGCHGSRRVSVVAPHGGQRIAVMPASVMAVSLLSDAKYSGLVSPAHWLTLEQLREECKKRDFELIVEEL